MKNCTASLRSLMLILVTTTLLLVGCAGAPIAPQSGVEPVDFALPPVSGFADDIQDIVLPPDMVWERKKSMTIKTESFRGGVWYYSGKLELISLKDFMVSSMQDNKWKLVGEVAAQNIMLAFVKSNKTCMMVLTDASFNKTELTLSVTIDKTAAAGLNPFGEAVTR